MKKSFVLSVALCIALIVGLCGCNQTLTSSDSVLESASASIQTMEPMAGEDVSVVSVTEDASTSCATLEEPIPSEKRATLLFVSDYQQKEGWLSPAENLQRLVDRVNEEKYRINQVLFCGDYTLVPKKSTYEISPDDSIAEIQSILSGLDSFDDVNQIIFEQGNHDKMTDAITPTGLYEYSDYFVYVQNTEDSFPYKQGKLGLENTVLEGAERLAKALQHLIDTKEQRPIIIAGHIPLHFTAITTSNCGVGDNIYAKYIFDVLNNAGISLNIVYLYGHLHSEGWDNYMGGSCVYRSRGERLIIPDAESGDEGTDSYVEETLNFTYLNAGYTGFFNDNNTSDNTLTCVVCEVYTDKLVLNRYSADGLHSISANGSANLCKDDTWLIPEKYYGTEKLSPQVVALRSSCE